MTGLGNIERRRGNHELSLERFREALDLKPDHATLPIDIASALRELDRLDEAIKYLVGLIECGFQSSSIFANLGRLYLDQGRVDDAFEFFEKGIKIFPKDIDCYLGYFNLAIENSLFLSAKKILENAFLNRLPKKPLNICEVTLYLRLNKIKIAKKIALELHRNYPMDFDYISLLIEICFKTSDLDSVSALIDKVIPVNKKQKVKLFIYKSELHRALFDIKAAKQFIGKALKLESLDISLYRRLARLNFMSGEFCELRKNLRKAEDLSIKSPNVFIKSNSKGGLLYQLLHELKEEGRIESSLQELLKKATLTYQEILVLYTDNPSNLLVVLVGLLFLRQKGIFLVPSKKNKQPNQIPSKITQFWDSSDVPKELNRIMLSWKTKNPLFIYRLFNDNTAKDFLLKHFPDRVYQAYCIAKHPAMRADILRLAYLYVEGGFYADADDFCMESLTSLRNSDSDLILLQEDLGSIGNNFIASIPKHPFIKYCLDAAINNVLEKKINCIWLATGPGLLTRSYWDYFYDSIKKGVNPNGVYIINFFEIQKLVMMHLSLGYKKDPRHWLSETNLNDSYN